MTMTSATIDSLLSYAWNDWEVTRKEMRRIVSALQADAAIDATITDLNASGGLLKLFTRVTDPGLLRQVVAVLASRSTSGTATARAALVSAKILNPVLTGTGPWLTFSADAFFDICHDLGAASVTHGFAAAVGAAGAPASAPSNPAEPFSGVGATGTNPATLSIGLIDQAALAAGHDATEARYSNPIPGSLPGYLGTLTPAQRLSQAQTVARQPISTLFPHAYRGSPPLRSCVMWAAGNVHDLQPELIAAVILAEQRDQSRNEDAKDYIGATSLMQVNTSIGLGQIVVSTARSNDLFADILSSAVRSRLSHNSIATLLASDEFNIFATARYIRIVANAASGISISTLPNTLSSFPGINMSGYALHSRHWPVDNVRALASEYTSRAWDDRLVVAWGDFVADAFDTYVRSGIAFP